MHHLCGMDAPFQRWLCTTGCGFTAPLGRNIQKGHSGREIRPLCKFSEHIVLKTLDLTGAGHPSWVSRAHSSFPSSEKQDARHLSKSEFEAVLSGLECVKRPVEDGLLAECGGDRSDLWHLQNGGIKATEKAT